MTAMAMDLPPDILREILTNFSTQRVVVHKPTSFPWFLGHICAGWRKLFLSMAMEFWSNLVIDLPAVKKKFPHSVAHFERTGEILDFCLTCNEGYPLSFSFGMRKSHYSEEYSHVTDMLDALIKQSMRWLKVEFHLQDAELQRLHHVKGHTLLLQSLQLRRFGDDVWFDTPVKPVAERFAGTFSNSPCLVQLRLSSLSTWKFDWSTILVLDLRSLLQTDVVNMLTTILPQATRLEELQIGQGDTFIRGPINIDDAQSIVTLPSLKKLAIDGHNILGALTAPGLEHLTFQRGGERIMTIPSFVHRSSCPLKHLSLWYSKPATAVEVLSHIPGLASLRLHDERDGIREFIKLFDRDDTPEGASLVAPRLKSLKMDIRAELNTSLLVELSAMIASRAQNPGVDGLRKLSLRTNSTKPGGDLTILKEQCKRHDVKLTVGRF